jgi:hypothetical protein
LGITQQTANNPTTGKVATFPVVGLYQNRSQILTGVLKKSVLQKAAPKSNEGGFFIGFTVLLQSPGINTTKSSTKMAILPEHHERKLPQFHTQPNAKLEASLILNCMNYTNTPATRSLLVFSLLASLLMGCTDTNSVVNPGEKPVVEAYLAPGQPVSIKLTKEIPYVTEGSEGEAIPISDAVITISNSAGKTYTLKVAEAGRYTSAPTELVGNAGTRYTMEFSYGGQPYRQQPRYHPAR